MPVKPYSATDGSRYNVCGAVTTTPRVELTARQLLEMPTVNESKVGEWVTISEGSRVDVLAYTYLGDSRLWWVIADLNRDIEDWYNIPAGALIYIPTLDSVAGIG